MSPRTLSTPTTISSLGNSFPRSSSHDSSFFCRNASFSTFSPMDRTQGVSDLFSCRSFGNSSYSPYPDSFCSTSMNVSHLVDQDSRMVLAPFSSVPYREDSPRTRSSVPRMISSESPRGETEASHVRKELSSVKGHILEMARDSSQCRVIQELLDRLNSKEIEEVYCEIRPSLFELIIDPFGNYLFQKFLEISSDERIYDMVGFGGSDSLGVLSFFIPCHCFL